MGMVNVQEQDAGKDDYNSIFHCSIILFVLVKEDLHVWNNFWRWNFYDNFQM